jgi:outer membrane protein, heavy metal efflux system
MSLRIRPLRLIAATVLIAPSCARSYDREVWLAPEQAAEPRIELQSWQGRKRADYVRFALENSFQLKAAFANWSAQQETIEISSTLPAPRLMFAEFLEEVQTRTGPQERKLGISQAFPWPGQLDAKAEVAEHRANAAWQKLESERLRIGSEVEVAYDNYAFLQREERVIVQLVEILHGFDPVVQARIRGGGSQQDLLRLQVEIGRAEDQLARVRARRSASFARLADRIGLRQLPVELPEIQLEVAPEVSLDPAKLHELALQRSPELRSLGALYDAARSEEDLAEFVRRPSFVVGVETVITGDASMPGVPGSGDDPWVISIGMDLPIWGPSYDAIERRARQELVAARARWDGKALDLRAAIENEVYIAEDAQRRVDLYRDILLPRAAEAMDLSLAAYRNGTATALDLIDSERTLLEFELAYWRANLDQWQAISRLRFLVGGEFS